MALAGDENLSLFCVNWFSHMSLLQPKSVFCNLDMFQKRTFS